MVLALRKGKRNQGYFDRYIGEAILSYKEALNYNSDYYWAYHSLGDAYYHQKDYEQAQENYEKALKIKEKEVDYLKRGEFDKISQEDIDRLRRTFYQMGVLFATQGKYNDAVLG